MGVLALENGSPKRTEEDGKNAPPCDEGVDIPALSTVGADRTVFKGRKVERTNIVLLTCPFKS
jgi:hypothetical protein